MDSHNSHSPYAVGQIVTGKVKSIHFEGICLAVEGVASALVTARSCGKGAARKQFLAQLKLGMDFQGQVKAYCPQTRQLVLNALASANVATPPLSKSVQGRKSQYQNDPPGTMYVFDDANIIGQTGPEHVARILHGIKAGVETQACKTVLLLEKRTLAWCRTRQATTEERDELEDLVRSGALTLVEGEADSVLLKLARSVPNVVCVTDDHLLAYKQAYPDLVGSSRIRSFTTCRCGDLLMIAVEGLPNAIVVPLKSPIEVAKMSEKIAEEPRFVPQPQNAGITNGGNEIPKEVPPLIQTASRLSLREPPVQTEKTAKLRLYLKGCLRRDDPATYRALAETYADSEEEDDKKMYAKYSAIAFRAEKWTRERFVRERRQNSIVRRAGYAGITHLSRQRMKQIALVEFIKRSRGCFRRCA